MMLEAVCYSPIAVSLGTFQVAQLLGGSGAVAVVIAGLVVGKIGLAREVSAKLVLPLGSMRSA